jgi:acyl-CoA thioesterase
MHLGAVLAELERGRSGEGFALEVPAEWAQGRTLYGGLNTALCAHAARLALAPAGELRAAQVAFVAPAAGTVRYEPTALRSGRSVTFISVDCISGDGLATRAILTYGRGRESPVRSVGDPMPSVPAPADCPPLPIRDGMPRFLHRMEVRFASGTPPFSGGETPAFAMWVRHLEATGVDPEIALLAVADTLPPAALALVDFSAPHPTSSITWTVDLAPPAAPADGWYLLEVRGEHTAGGYSLQSMRCFAADGRLAAAGRQTVAVF